MLNWIAIWVGHFLFGLGGPLQNDHPVVRARSRTTSPRCEALRLLGRSDFQGLHVGLFIALCGPRRLLLILNRTTLGYGVRAVGFNPRGGPLRRHQRPATTSSRWRSPARSPGSPGASTFSAGSSGSARRHPGLGDRLHRHRRRAPRAQHGDRCRALARSCSAACTGHVDPQPATRRSSDPQLASNLTLLIQGLVFSSSVPT